MARRLAGVRFQRAGRVHYCDPGGLDLGVDDQVVVQAPWGLAVGRVVITPQQVLHVEGVEASLPILRHATAEDLAAQRATPGA